MLVPSDPDFCTKQVDLQVIPSQDMAKLQRSIPESALALSSMGPQYVIELVKLLRNVVSGNVQVANGSKVDLNVLNMSKPDRMKKSVELILSLMDYLVKSEDTIVRLRQAGINAEIAVAQTKVENERLSSACAAAQVKVTNQEAVLKRLMQERAQEKAATLAAESSMQAQLQKTYDEFGLLKTAHSKCAGSVSVRMTVASRYLVHKGQTSRILIFRVQQLHERDLEIDSLTKVCQQLVTSLGGYQDSERKHEALMSLKNDEVAKLKAAHDTLQSELVQSQVVYKSSQRARVEEYDQLTAEIRRLEDDLRAKNVSCDVLRTQNVKLEYTLKELQDELTTSMEQLSLSDIHSVTLNATIEDLISRQTADLDAAHIVAAQERELRLESDVLLANAAEKIESLEKQLRTKDQEISKLHEIVARNAAQTLRSPISPPHRLGRQRLRQLGSGPLFRAQSCSTWGSYSFCSSSGVGQFSRSSG
ncbi:hypothetical protein C8Q80DRAFT_48146 [Daedaleopsis nitida]|nr:hypothetical protein C8Q80DRAFT_48146 [Daedaleopsis nitida]